MRFDSKLYNFWRIKSNNSEIFRVHTSEIVMNSNEKETLLVSSQIWQPQNAASADLFFMWIIRSYKKSSIALGYKKSLIDFEEY